MLPFVINSFLQKEHFPSNQRDEAKTCGGPSQEHRDTAFFIQVRTFTHRANGGNLTNMSFSGILKMLDIWNFLKSLVSYSLNLSSHLYNIYSLYSFWRPAFYPKSLIFFNYFSVTVWTHTVELKAANTFL